MNLQQLLPVLRARWKFIASIWILLIAAAVAVTLLMPKKYEADADIMLDLKAADAVTGAFVPGMMMTSFMGTQIDLVKSRKVADKVIDKLKLDQNPQMVDAWRNATDGAGDIRVWLFNTLSLSLTVTPSRDSNLFEISFTGPDPQAVSDIVNTYANSYMEAALDMRVSPAGENAAWFKERLEAVRAEVDRAQVALSDFRREKQLIGDPRSRIDSETAQLNEMANQLTLAQTTGADLQSKRGGGDLSSSPEVMDNALVQNLRVQVAETRAKLQDTGSRLGLNHPEYKRTAAQLTELESQLGAQMGRIRSSLSMMGEQGARKVETLKKSMEEQRQTVITLNADMDRLGVLQHQLEVAEASYQTISQRYLQTNLESQSTSTNISLVTPASPPLLPASPRPLLNIAVAIFLGGVFGIAGALALELTDRRIRDAADFEISSGMPLPLLGVVPNGTKPSKQDRRLEERRLRQISGPTSAAS
ncbi:chain length determinant protein EpsF [Hydrocarboniphaga sp.]|uniref:chain length determinant protein EpsF n=1 Tax=Hydrocarboniphaga sp. TaxID=2033016 RepID=UPI003D13B84B